MLRASGRAGRVLSTNAGRDGPSPRAREPMPLLLALLLSTIGRRSSAAVVPQGQAFESGLYGIICDAHWGVRESRRCSRFCVSTLRQRLWRIGTCFMRSKRYRCTGL